jgi:hypothetical protein
MIDPAFLDATYVVRNEGLGYESADETYSAKRTKINATKYRTFVIAHPDKTNYYKPILDVLDYHPGLLEAVPNVVMVEGKTDFYLLKYFSEIILKNETTSQKYFLPGTGSGNLAQSIRLYLGWSRQFLVLLDSDPEGVSQKLRYAEEFGLACSERTFMLEDSNPDWANKAIEGLISEEDRLLIQQHAYPDAMKYHKTHFHRSLQEVLMRKVELLISDHSKSNFNKLFAFLDTKFTSTQNYLSSNEQLVLPN